MAYNSTDAARQAWATPKSASRAAQGRKDVPVPPSLSEMHRLLGWDEADRTERREARARKRYHRQQARIRRRAHGAVGISATMSRSLSALPDVHGSDGTGGRDYYVATMRGVKGSGSVISASTASLVASTPSSIISLSSLPAAAGSHGGKQLPYVHNPRPPLLKQHNRRYNASASSSLGHLRRSASNDMLRHELAGNSSAEAMFRHQLQTPTGGAGHHSLRREAGAASPPPGQLARWVGAARPTDSAMDDDMRTHVSPLSHGSRSVAPAAPGSDTDEHDSGSEAWLVHVAQPLRSPHLQARGRTREPASGRGSGRVGGRGSGRGRGKRRRGQKGRSGQPCVRRRTKRPSHRRSHSPASRSPPTVNKGHRSGGGSAVDARSTASSSSASLIAARPARPYSKSWQVKQRRKRRPSWPRSGIVAERKAQLKHLEFSLAQRAKLKALIDPAAAAEQARYLNLLRERESAVRAAIKERKAKKRAKREAERLEALARAAAHMPAKAISKSAAPSRAASRHARRPRRRSKRAATASHVTGTRRRPQQAYTAAAVSPPAAPTAGRSSPVANIVNSPSPPVANLADAKASSVTLASPVALPVVDPANPPSSPVAEATPLSPSADVPAAPSSPVVDAANSPSSQVADATPLSPSADVPAAVVDAANPRSSPVVVATTLSPSADIPAAPSSPVVDAANPPSSQVADATPLSPSADVPAAVVDAANPPSSPAANEELATNPPSPLMIPAQEAGATAVPLSTSDVAPPSPTPLPPQTGDSNDAEWGFSALVGGDEGVDALPSPTSLPPPPADSSVSAMEHGDTLESGSDDDDDLLLVEGALSPSPREPSSQLDDTVAEAGDETSGSIEGDPAAAAAVHADSMDASVVEDELPGNASAQADVTATVIGEKLDSTTVNGPTDGRNAFSTDVDASATSADEPTSAAAAAMDTPLLDATLFESSEAAPVVNAQHAEDEATGNVPDDAGPAAPLPSEAPLSPLSPAAGTPPVEAEADHEAVAPQHAPSTEQDSKAEADVAPGESAPSAHNAVDETEATPTADEPRASSDVDVDEPEVTPAPTVLIDEPGAPVVASDEPEDALAVVANELEDTAIAAVNEPDDTPAVAADEADDTPVTTDEAADTPATMANEPEDTPAITPDVADDTPTTAANELEDTPAAKEPEDTPAVATEEPHDTSTTTDEADDTPVTTDEAGDRPATTVNEPEDRPVSANEPGSPPTASPDEPASTVDAVPSPPEPEEVTTVATHAEPVQVSALESTSERKGDDETRRTVAAPTLQPSASLRRMGSNGGIASEVVRRSHHVTRWMIGHHMCDVAITVRDDTGGVADAMLPPHRALDATFLTFSRPGVGENGRQLGDGSSEAARKLERKPGSFSHALVDVRVRPAPVADSGRAAAPILMVTLRALVYCRVGMPMDGEATLTASAAASGVFHPPSILLRHRLLNSLFFRHGAGVPATATPSRVGLDASYLSSDPMEHRRLKSSASRNAKGHLVVVSLMEEHQPPGTLLPQGVAPVFRLQGFNYSTMQYFAATKTLQQLRASSNAIMAEMARVYDGHLPTPLARHHDRRA